MTAHPTVSVVIPAYNAAKTLRACLASVYAQTHPVAEVVVVDDASTDTTRAIAAGFPCTLVAQPVNRGVSAARNTGVATSHGDVVFFLDSDVALAPDAVAAAVGHLVADPTLGCVYGIYDREPLIDDGPVERYRILHLHSALTRAVGRLDTAVFALAALPRAVLDAVGPFDENLRAAEDDDYSERLLGRYGILLTADVVGRHDEADRLLPLLAEQYHRAQLLRFSARNRFRPAALKLNPAPGVLAAALAVATAPAALLWPPLAALPLGFLAVFAAADPPLVRLIHLERGTAFLVRALGVHLLVNLALVAGAATGWLRAAVDPRFGPTHRRRPPVATPVESTEGW
ncbi:MAG TPA: glycosyltransferase [Micromonospora sp.]